MRAIEIDGSKLKKLLEQRNIDSATVSVKLGCSRTYISDCVRRNKISDQSVKMLSMLYGIGLEDIKKDDPVKPEEEKLDLFGNDEMYKTIYTAVYNAIKDAMKEI